MRFIKKGKIIKKKHCDTKDSGYKNKPFVTIKIDHQTIIYILKTFCSALKYLYG